MRSTTRAFMLKGCKHHAAVVRKSRVRFSVRAPRHRLQWLPPPFGRPDGASLSQRQRVERSSLRTLPNAEENAGKEKTTSDVKHRREPFDESLNDQVVTLGKQVTVAWQHFDVAVAGDRLDHQTRL